MISKESKLDLEALISQMVNGKGYLHYGYWEHGAVDEITLRRLGEAQQAYFHRLAETIPPGIRSILDVGSGTGSNALELVQKGYAVDCVCPSPKLNQIARLKLPHCSRIYESRFEDVELAGNYDLMIFPESFHYMNARAALRKMSEHALRNVIVFDYFPRTDSSDMVRVSHAQFTHLVSHDFADRLRIASDRDLTMEIIPTFQLLDALKDNYARPYVERAIADFRQSHPIYSLLLAWPLRKLLAKVGKKNDRAKNFLNSYEYRLILLSRR